MAMLFLGTSGPFGKYIDLPVPLTIGIRAFFGLWLILAYCRWRHIPLRLARKDVVPILISGLLMGVHWVSYFYSLHLSNVAIGMLSLFTYPVMTAFLEPIFLGSRFQKLHLLLGIMVIFGVYLLAPGGGLNGDYLPAIGLGLLSALSYATRNLILKVKVESYQGSLLMGYQLIVVTLVMLPVFFIYDLSMVPSQWPGLAGLIVVTTVLGHSLFINTFRHFSITTISIMSCVQPLYGILLGALFLHEVPSWSTVWGGTLILASVVIEAYRSYLGRRTMEKTY